jgi:hypothetical protein
MTAIPPSPPRPASPGLNSPFYRCMQSESIVNDGQDMTGEEIEWAEKWMKQQQEETKKRFLEEVRRKQFAHVFRCEVKVKKGSGK